jgi:hypothetical protein
MHYLCIVLATPKGHPAASTIHKISSLGDGTQRVPGRPQTPTLGSNTYT